MSASEALICCLGFTSATPEDGELRSQTVYDCHGEPHWIAWRVGCPALCSESWTPFARAVEPYRTQRDTR